MLTTESGRMDCSKLGIKDGAAVLVSFSDKNLGAE